MMLNHKRTLMFAGFTAVFIGYLTVWLPGPGAGLSFLGVEIGEWIKFLGVGPRRDVFYLPPITLALSMSLMTITWPNESWRTWAMRGLAVSVSLLSFPAIEAIRFEPQSEWLLRLALIGLVVLLSSLIGAVGRSGANQRAAAAALGLTMAVGLLGAVWPSWMYLTVRPLVSQVTGVGIGIGPGVWLNATGHLLLVIVSGLILRERKIKPAAVQVPV